MKKRKRTRWEPCIEPHSCIIPIGRRGSEEAPIWVFGKYLKNPEKLAWKICHLLNKSER